MSVQAATVSRQPATRLCSPGSSPAIRLQRSGGDGGWEGGGKADREEGDRQTEREQTGGGRMEEKRGLHTGGAKRLEEEKEESEHTHVKPTNADASTGCRCNHV